MKKSGSRASKLSTDAQDSVENPLPGIPDAKWHELLEKEETELFILGLREEIISKCMEICFSGYLEKQAVAFTVHCAYLAYCKVFNVYYMVRDPGSIDDPKERESWEPDKEPKPSQIDSWGRQCITLLEPSKTEKEAQEAHVIQSKTTASTAESLDLCSFYSDLLHMEAGEYNYYSPKLFLPPEVSNTKSSSSSTCSVSKTETVPKSADDKFFCSRMDIQEEKKKKQKMKLTD